MAGDASCAMGTYDGPEASNATCSFNPNPSMSFFDEFSNNKLQ